ncbi:hypothetical protein KY285_027491 [Solanum tuberosum]|nr:hypothetical protein KY289_027690 [Solanum tuberosum]KAH0666285.1 hypothetical protein KY285_027491 [Solanum tuberosum]
MGKKRGLPNWVPDGWKVEVRTLKKGKIKKDKMASKRKTSESVSDKSSKVAKVQTSLEELVVQKQNENMKIVEEVDKNKNEEEKEINDEDGDDEETENDKEDEEEGEKESEEGNEEDGDENESDEGDVTESEEGDEDVVKTFNIDKFQNDIDLSEANNACFQMSMVYDLLKRRIKYKGDDDDALEDKNKKMDEIWIN